MSSLKRVFELAKATWEVSSQRRATLLAAGVAFYAFLSLFPAMIAAISIYALVSSPHTVQDQVETLTRLLPDSAKTLVTTQMGQILATPRSSLGAGAIIAIALALYAASSAFGNLMSAINLLYGHAETRGFLHRKLLAVTTTAGAIIVMTATIGLLAVLPTVERHIPLVPGTRLFIDFGRWIGLIGLIITAIAALFRISPDRKGAHRPAPRFFNVGTLVASAGWIATSAGFSAYVNTVGNYSATYGALAGVVALMLWLWIGTWSVLLGATLQAQLEDTPTRTDV